MDTFRAAGIDAAYVLCAGPNAGRTLHDNSVVDLLWDLDANGDPKWYPGDAWVDWLGVDLFTPDQVSGSSLSPALEKTLEFADLRKKPVFVSEVSPLLGKPAGCTDPMCDDQCPNHDTVWEDWFIPFFDLFDHERVKAFCYIYWNWPEHGGFSTWTNAQFECNAEVLTNYVAELETSRFVHLSTTGAARFDHPWWVEAGGEVDQSASSYTVYGANGNSDGGAPPLAYFYVSDEREEDPCTDPSKLCEDLGIPLLQGSQTFFPKDPVLVGPLATNGDGTFSITVNGSVFSGLAGSTFYVQALLLEQGQSIPRATNQFVLHVTN